MRDISLNLQMAIQRLEAAEQVLNAFGINNARVRAQAAASANGLNGKLNQLQNALAQATQLQALLGTGPEMTLGEGNLMR